MACGEACLCTGRYEATHTVGPEPTFSGTKLFTMRFRDTIFPNSFGSKTGKPPKQAAAERKDSQVYGRAPTPGLHTEVHVLGTVGDPARQPPPIADTI